MPFADSDDLVEAADGRTVRAIFAESGEAAFRAAESSAVLSALRDFDGVLSLGGGALNLRGHPRRTRRRRRAGRRCCGRRHGRCSRGSATARTRPLLAADPAARLAELAARTQRPSTSTRPRSASTPTASRSGQVAATIAARLHEREVRARG